MDNARVEYPLYKKNGELSKKIKVRYICAQCKGEFPSDGVQVDHIEEIGSLKSLEELENFADKLFCDKEGMQVLCKDICHQEKTNAWREIRRLL